MNLFKRLFGVVDWISFFSDYANDEGTKDLERLMILLWPCWNLRNDSICNGRAINLVSKVEWSVSLTKDFRKAICKATSDKLEPVTQPGWLAPLVRWVAMSTDAATYYTRGRLARAGK